MKPYVRYALARDVSGRRAYLGCRNGSNFMDTPSPLHAKHWDSTGEIKAWIDALPDRDQLISRGVKLGEGDLSHREEFDGRGYRIILLRIEITATDPMHQPARAAS